MNEELYSRITRKLFNTSKESLILKMGENP
jgi:hypothetical protein